MKEIIIRAIRFINFKGLRDLTISFPAKNIDISGDNGLGKSSIFDGVTWVFFGKDRLNREHFGIKTLDSDNRAIPRIPHEVEIDLTVNGEPLKLARRYEEKWVRHKGASEETFEGHTETRLYNNVPCSVSDWKAKISDICTEEVFKFITNPLYFSAQKMEVQREMLIQMAGGVSDAEVAAGNEEFAALLSSITGKTMAGYRKEIKAERARVKNEIKDLPGRIKENESKYFEPEDWSALEAERDNLTEERTSIMKQLSDVLDSENAKANARAKIQRDINSIRSMVRDREFEIEQEIKKGYRSQVADRRALLDEHASLTREVSHLKTEKTRYINQINQCAETRQRLLGEYERLQDTSRALVAKYNEEPEMTASDFSCPTCGHQYDIDRIEEIQANIRSNHRAKIAEYQKQNAAAIAENKKQGQANNKNKEHYQQCADETGVKITMAEARIAEIESMPLYITAPTEPDATPAINSDTKIGELHKQMTALEESLNTEPEKTDTSELRAKAEQISDRISEIAVRLSKRDDMEAHKKRLEELQAELRAGTDEISRLEGIEFTIAAFTKARVSKVEDKINSLFSFVRFKLFNFLNDGTEVEACEAMVDGVPFSYLNDAGKLNAGLDIINAICKFQQVYAPIFLDNSESVNRPIPTESQRVRLIVTKEPELTIRPTENNPTLF